MRRFFWIYGTLVLLSNLWIVIGGPTRFDASPAPTRTGFETLEVISFEQGQRGTAKVRLAYKTLGDPDTEAVLLLHGSPGSLQDFEALGEVIAQDRFVVVPNMLGFGDSERAVADHSFVAQADALIQLLDARGIERAHLVGFSWGGGVAIELGARIPDRTESIVMVSAIGVQELELLGHFGLNRLVHRLQHVLVVAARWGLPHFGALDRSPLSTGFSRSFLDSDQRPLRGHLERWNGPMMVLHGEDDFLVPVAAAREHARIVPQSRAVWLAGGHLVLWSHAIDVKDALLTWFDDVDAGDVQTRAQATPDRVAEAAQPFDLSLARPQSGLGWLVFALLVFAASMVSEDLTCAGVGLLVAAGQIGWVGGIAACIFALVAGDLVLYFAGRFLGGSLLDRWQKGPSQLETLRSRLDDSVGRVVLLGRFVPGARLPTYVAAGALRSSLLPFTFFLIVAAALWAPFLIGLSALGARTLNVHAASPRTAFWLGAALILSIAIAARFGPQMLTHRGRRLLLSRWRRLRRWEFWPIWAIYWPLVPSMARMAARHRSIRAVTLVNPPIPGGGLAGESKADLDKVLSRIPEHAIATAIIEPGSPETARAEVLAFMAERGIAFPIVLKPDVGERGRGVEIIRDEPGIQAYFERNPGLCLAQAFVPGPEFGLFFVRHPSAAAGELFSVARKEPRSVVGNGRDSLEVLILEDPICLPMAPKLLAQNEARLGSVPAAGERVQVATLGTHSLGCRFLIGEDLRTPALEAAVDRLSQTAGLDFGRYDVRAPDEAALRAGHFQIIEFNGLTGEAAHCYDPKYGLRAGLSILREQWRIAYEIGAAHRHNGRRPLSYRALWRLVIESRE